MVQRARTVINQPWFYDFILDISRLLHHDTKYSIYIYLLGLSHNPVLTIWQPIYLVIKTLFTKLYEPNPRFTLSDRQKYLNGKYYNI